MTVAIEPMVTLGTEKWDMDDDGWTIRTSDGSAAAHHEHSVWIRKDEPWILSHEEAPIALSEYVKNLAI